MTTALKLDLESAIDVASAAAMLSGEAVGSYSSALISDLSAGESVGAYSSALISSTDFDLVSGQGLHMVSSAL